jgi:hypothetical protein
MPKNGPASRVASARSPSTQTDASSGGKYSDRWGDKCTDRCLKWR